MLKIRTGYSFRAAAGTLEDCMNRLVAIGADCAPITDRASTFAFARWQALAEKAGLRPVYGIELAVSPDIHAKKPQVDYWTFLATDSLQPINELLYKATDQFRYEPLLTYAQAQEATGCVKVIGGNARLDQTRPAPDLYVGLAPGVARGYINKAIAMGHRLIATGDNKYPNVADESFYELVCGRGASMQTYPRHILSEDEWRAAVAYIATPVAISAALTAAKQVRATCLAKITKGALLKPVRSATLRAMCAVGAEKLGCDMARPEYAARLDRELALIEEKQFEDYFYIVADMMAFARSKMLCGPARGSSSGSLVCYLLEITSIDPIKFGLLFERFIDITRSDLPDIDLDFSDQKRHMVFEYMEQKYGRDHVAHLGTVALFRPRSAIEAAGAALKVPRYLCDRLLDSLIERSGGDARALQTLEDTFSTTAAGQELIAEYPEIQIAQRMEGHPRHYSMHAAGIVVTENPVLEYVGINAKTGGTHCDKKDAEALNLLKIDALGLTQLSVFEDALELAGKPMNFLESVPLDDQNVFRVFNEGRFSGIFQFNGAAIQKICEQVTINNFEDIVSITALGRPGPITSGGMQEWMNRRVGKEQVIYTHPIFEPYLKATLGVVIYQEQVMKIGREVGGLSWQAVTALRKAMSKSLGKEYFDQYGARFIEGGLANGVPKEALQKMWESLCTMGAWCFNRSHAVAYGVVSYWCAYMKAYHAAEFAAATLSHTPDIIKQIMTLREMREEGIDYAPVDKARSADKWAIDLRGNAKVLIGPLQNVHGCGPKMVQSILSARARNEPPPARFEKLFANPKTKIDSLWPIRDAFARAMPEPAARNIHTAPTKIGDLIASNEERTVLLFGVIRRLNLRDENEAINVQRRGGRVYKTHTYSLNLQVCDDTGQIFCKIDRMDYDRIGKAIVDYGRVGKALYVFKGAFIVTASGFKLVRVSHVRLVGDTELEIDEGEQAAEEGEEGNENQEAE